MKRYAVLSALVLMFSFSTVSAQTLDQYQPAQPTMDQLSTSSSLRANLSTGDLEKVYTYCENKLRGFSNAYQTTLRYVLSVKYPANASWAADLPGEKQSVDTWTGYCSAIQVELSNRPVSSPTINLTVPQKTPQTPPATVTAPNQVVATTDTVQITTLAELTDLFQQIKVLDWFMGMSIVFFLVIAWILIKR